MGTATFSRNQQSVLEQPAPFDQSSLVAEFETPKDDVDGMGRWATDSVRANQPLQFGSTLGLTEGDIMGDDQMGGGDEELSQPARRRTTLNVIPASSTVDEDEGIENDGMVAEPEGAVGTCSPRDSIAYD